MPAAISTLHTPPPFFSASPRSSSLQSTSSTGKVPSCASGRLSLNSLQMPVQIRRVGASVISLAVMLVGRALPGAALLTRGRVTLRLRSNADALPLLESTSRLAVAARQVLLRRIMVHREHQATKLAGPQARRRCPGLLTRPFLARSPSQGLGG